MCRGHGPEAGLLVDWLAFNFARRLLTWLHGTHLASQDGSKYNDIKLRLDNAHDIREILKVTYAESEDEQTSADNSRVESCSQ